jgi:acyl dehydratase
MDFRDFAVGQVFMASFTMTMDDFQNYIAFARIRNVLHENAELAAKEGINGVLLPGRSVIARAEGEMTRLPQFSDCIMLLYGMDGDMAWGGRQTRFLGEVCVGDALDTRYPIVSKKKKKGMAFCASTMK